jgi:hypothetical protein
MVTLLLFTILAILILLCFIGPDVIEPRHRR